MKTRRSLLQMSVGLVSVLVLLVSPVSAQASTPDPLLGIWYGDWQSDLGLAGTFQFDIITDGSSYYAIMYIPDLGVDFDFWLVDVDGATVTMGGLLVGTVTGNLMEGEQDLLLLPYPPYYVHITWQAVRAASLEFDIGPGPGAECENLPPLLCTGSAEHCSELVAFDPTSTTAYIDYPVNGETWENQYRSYLRRDLMQLVHYAAAKLECKAAAWDYSSFNPVGLLDMSEADGSIPGTSIGAPGHPLGSHTDGNDIDIAYYQVYRPDNQPRTVCNHYELTSDGYVDAYHCTSSPHVLDPWRTALFMAFLAEHPHLRVVGVDGKVGPLLKNSLDWFAANGWISPALRGSIPWIYEETDLGYGFFLFHHHHMHVSLEPEEPVLLNIQIEPETLNLINAGKYITVYIELVPGYDPGDIHSVSITADGYSTIAATPGASATGDYDQDGIPDLMVKFDRHALQAVLSPGTVEITLYGMVDGIRFQGADSIRVK